MKTKLLCFGLILIMVFSMTSCEKSNVEKSEPTSEMPTTSNEAPNTVPTNASTEEATNQNAKSALLSDLDEENDRLLKELKNKNCLFEFGKKLYPAEKIFDIVELDLPEKINDHYWRQTGIIDDETLIVNLIEKNPRYGPFSTMTTESGIYNFVNDEYETVYKLDTNMDPYVYGIYPLENKKEFVVLDGIYLSPVTANIAYFYVNIETGELRLLTSLNYEEFSFMLSPSLIGRDLYYNRKTNKDSYALMKLNIDSGEEEQIDNYGVLPRAYNGSVAYISMDTNNHTATIKGTDFFKTWIQNDPRLEGLSSPHGSLAAHQNSKDFFILTKTTDTEELIENVKELFEDYDESYYPLFTVKKYNANNPEGELIFMGRGSVNGMSLHVDALNYNGRLLSWYTCRNEIPLVYDNELDVLLYFSDIEVGSSKNIFTDLSKSDYSGYIVASKDYEEVENETWETRFKRKKHIIYFKVKDEYK